MARILDEQGNGSSGQIDTGQSNTDGSEQTISAYELDYGADVTVPDNSFIQDSNILRHGQDLHLETADGSFIVEGYFAVDTPPTLISENGQILSEKLVESFVQSPGNNVYAQQGTLIDESPVGAVEEIDGNATLTRTDGTTIDLTIGTPVYQGDIIETQPDSAVKITFVDDSTFAVSDNARVAIDEFKFDDGSDSGATDFSVLKGVFMYTSGLIGREDPDDVHIETPQGSIGIRGTTIAGDIQSGEVTVLEGAIVLRASNGEEVTLANQFETAKFDTQQGGIDYKGVRDAGEFAEKYASIKSVSADIFNSFDLDDKKASQSEPGSNENTQDQTEEQKETQEGTEATEDQSEEDATLDSEAEGESAAEGEDQSNLDADNAEAAAQEAAQQAIDAFVAEIGAEGIDNNALAQAANLLFLAQLFGDEALLEQALNLLMAIALEQAEETTEQTDDDGSSDDSSASDDGSGDDDPYNPDDPIDNPPPPPSEIFGTPGDDNLASTAGGQDIFGFGGNDQITILHNGVNAFGGSGSDTFTVTGQNNIGINGGFGSDFINAIGVNGLNIFGGEGAGNDTINVENSTNLNISGGSGNDIFNLIRTADGSVQGGDGDDIFNLVNSKNLDIDGGEGSDNFVIGGDLSTELNINGNDGFDVFFVSDGNNNTFSGGEGSDNFTISGGFQNKFYGGEGVDFFFINGGSNNEFFGNQGQDNFMIRDNISARINGGGMDDIVTLTARPGSTDWSVGGYGEDLALIQISNVEILNSVNMSDDNIHIYYDDSLHGINIARDTSTAVDGALDTITLDIGSVNVDRYIIGDDISLLDNLGFTMVAMDNSDEVTTHFDSDGENLFSITTHNQFDGSITISTSMLLSFQVTNHIIGGSIAANTLKIFGDDNLVSLIGGNDGLTLMGDNNEVNLGDGNDSFYLDGGSNNIIRGDTGNDYFELFVSTPAIGNTLDGGSGDDSFALGNTENTVAKGGDGNDLFVVYGGENGSLFGENGNDTFILNGGSGYTIDTGNGENIVTFNGGSAWNVKGGALADQFEFTTDSIIAEIDGLGGKDRLFINISGDYRFGSTVSSENIKLNSVERIESHANDTAIHIQIDQDLMSNISVGDGLKLYNSSFDPVAGRVTGIFSTEFNLKFDGAGLTNNNDSITLSWGEETQIMDTGVQVTRDQYFLDHAELDPTIEVSIHGDESWLNLDLGSGDDTLSIKDDTNLEHIKTLDGGEGSNDQIDVLDNGGNLDFGQVENLNGFETINLNGQEATLDLANVISLMQTSENSNNVVITNTGAAGSTLNLSFDLIADFADFSDLTDLSDGGLLDTALENAFGAEVSITDDDPLNPDSSIHIQIDGIGILTLDSSLFTGGDVNIT